MAPACASPMPIRSQLALLFSADLKLLWGLRCWVWTPPAPHLPPPSGLCWDSKAVGWGWGPRCQEGQPQSCDIAFPLLQNHHQLLPAPIPSFRVPSVSRKERVRNDGVRILPGGICMLEFHHHDQLSTRHLLNPLQKIWRGISIITFTMPWERGTATYT